MKKRKSAAELAVANHRTTFQNKERKNELQN
jgi:hypothetical protein